jgi:hypothetical protein
VSARGGENPSHVSGRFDPDLDGLLPDDAESEQPGDRLWADDLLVLADHHVDPERTRSYVLAHDRSQTYGTCEAPQLITLDITRDLAQG